MKEIINREYLLDANEVRDVILYWLEHQHGIESPDRLSSVKYSPAKEGTLASIKWGEEVPE